MDPRRVGRDDPSDRSAEASTEDVLSLLGDEYACRILAALDEGPRPAADLVERCGMSRPTAYRRLDRLEDAGLVDSRLQLDPDGHHRKEFRLAVDEVELRVGERGVDGTVRAGGASD